MKCQKLLIDIQSNEFTDCTFILLGTTKRRFEAPSAPPAKKSKSEALGKVLGALLDLD